MRKTTKNLVYLLKVLLGLEEEWKNQFDNDTKQKIEKLKGEQAKRGMLTSGIGKRKIGQLEIKRKQEKKDEARKRLLEGLKLLPPWIALLISIISLIISLSSL